MLSKYLALSLVFLSILLLAAGCSTSGSTSTTAPVSTSTVAAVTTSPIQTSAVALPSVSSPSPGVTATAAPASSPADTFAGPAAKNGDVVQVDYTLKLDDGTVVDSSIGKVPLQFTLGSGQMIPGFDKAVVGMQVGQSKTVVLPPDQAYGLHRADQVQTVNKSQFAPGTNLSVGQHLTATRTDGTTFSVVIIAATDTTVTLDANSPLAGKTLTFDIKLIAIVSPK